MNQYLFAQLCCLSALLPAQVRPLPPAVHSVRVRLQDFKGGPVQDATVQLVGVGPGALNYRRLPDQEPRAVTAKDFAGDALKLADLPDGEFVLMVESPLFAKSLSVPFKLPSDKEAEIVVLLGRGGVLEGSVMGKDRKPLAGAIVRTKNGNLAHAGPMAAILANMVADPTTATSVTTAADGTYRLERLAHGKYQLVVEHPEFVSAEVDAEVTGDDPKKVPAVQLQDGVLITGRVLRGGQPVPGVDVMFQSEDASELKDSAQAMKIKTFKMKTDDKGDFRLPSRVPVGKGYVLMAAEPGSPLEQGSQFQSSRVRFDVPAGRREQVEVVFLKPR
jgi:hypothetical protein